MATVITTRLVISRDVRVVRATVLYRDNVRGTQLPDHVSGSADEVSKNWGIVDGLRGLTHLSTLPLARAREHILQEDERVDAMSDEFGIWGKAIPKAWLTDSDQTYLESMPRELPNVEWIWGEMDRIWHEIGLRNKAPLADQPIAQFYHHPVWLVNGIFTACDEVSIENRANIAIYLKSIPGEISVADFGGGLGELAIAIARELPRSRITIIEPFPSRAAIERLRPMDQIEFRHDAADGDFDVVIAQDVLEHLEDPVMFAFRMANSLKPGGTAIFANCFWPVIECHLPRTFHLRHTFRAVMWAMGLTYVGVVPGAEYAQIFRRTGVLNRDRAIRYEALSRVLGSGLNLFYGIRGFLWHRVFRR